MTGRPTYLFGVGATKAGTSWLYRYLSGHPDCHMRAVKELHYFNAAGPQQRAQRITIETARLERLKAELAGESRAWRLASLAASIADVEDWLRVLRGEQSYQDYLERGAEGAKLVGDITPAYASLSVARLSEMASAAPDCRFVYLLREPVSRLWSHVRMVAKRAGGDLATQASVAFERALSGEKSDVAARSDYRGAITRLRAAVAPSKLLILFQEELFSAPGLARLCAFLGIRVQAADTTARVHEGQPLAMTAEQRLRARAFLQSQYDFVASAFGTLPASWRATSDGVTG
ncbi:sulfotransferase family protein [Falsigemmobacter intermedius]|uniref:Sulfotransferase n=1 Tax=Falsigemmobacter intermedius TaxID=1553448 RepID=A0A3S3UWX8_9RHOB|nr:sulfotransferase [Falsigemmobacter intermedius]RWY41746.1 sulfotransferase [Falsigemmobacter intermedius]